MREPPPGRTFLPQAAGRFWAAAVPAVGEILPPEGQRFSPVPACGGRAALAALAAFQEGAAQAAAPAVPLQAAAWLPATLPQAARDWQPHLPPLLPGALPSER